MNEELRIIITAEIDKLKQELQKGKKEVEKFGKEGGNKLATFNEAMGKVGSAANKAMAVAGAAIAGAATALLALSASTAEYRANQAKLTTSFESAGASAETAKNTYNDLYRVLGDDGQAIEAANHLALLTTNEKDLAEWTNICQGIYATFGDSLPIESLTEAANETAKTGAVTGALADAINWAALEGETFGVSLKKNTKKNQEWNEAVKAATTAEDYFNLALQQCNTEAEREALIRETLNGVYSDASAKYEQNAADVLAANEAQTKLNEATAKLGEAMAPVNAALTEFAAAFIEQIAPAIQDFVDNYGAALTEGLTKIAEAIGVVVGWITDNIELVGTVAGVILAIVAAINLYNAAMAIYNIVMAPVNLTILAIVAAIVALIAIITAIIVYWDELKAVAVKCWEGIKNAFSKAGQWFSDIFNKAWNGIKNAFSKVGSFFKGIWDTITGIFSKVGSAIGNAISGTVKKAVNGVLTLAVGYINGFISAINLAISIINAIPGVNISKIKKLEVPKLAKGGIATGDTLAHIGEEGYREAVLPLDRNTEWMDMLAARLGERIGGGNVPVVIEVDGKTFGRTAISTINANTRQTGKLALNIM